MKAQAEHVLLVAPINLGPSYAAQMWLQRQQGAVAQFVQSAQPVSPSPLCDSAEQGSMTAGNVSCIRHFLRSPLHTYSIDGRLFTKATRDSRLEKGSKAADTKHVSQGADPRLPCKVCVLTGERLLGLLNSTALLLHKIFSSLASHLFPLHMTYKSASLSIFHSMVRAASLSRIYSLILLSKRHADRYPNGLPIGAPSLIFGLNYSAVSQRPYILGRNLCTPNLTGAPSPMLKEEL